MEALPPQNPAPKPVARPAVSTLRTPLIVLSALVIIEAGLIGLFVWRMAEFSQDQEKKDTELRALHDQVAASKVEADAESAPKYAAIARNTVTLTPEDGSGIPDLTPLQGVVMGKSVADTCLQFLDLVNEKGVFPYKNQFAWNDLDKAAVRAKIAAFVGDPSRTDKIVEDMKRWAERGAYIPNGSLCRDGSDLYAFLALPGYEGVQPMRATDEEFLPINSMLKTMDLAYGFIPEAIDGKPVFTTGYGDAGHWWWNYYLFDEPTNGLDLVESCSANFAYGDQGFIEDKVEYECPRVYRMPNM